MATASAERTGVVRALLFMLAGQVFAVEVKHTREVVVFEDWTAVPGAPDHLAGTANLRGSVIPILTIQGLLGLPPGQVAQRRRALVVARPSGLVAILIESTLGLESFREVTPCGFSTRREYGDLALGLVEWQGRMLPLLDMPRILTALKAQPA